MKLVTNIKMYNVLRGWEDYRPRQYISRYIYVIILPSYVLNENDLSRIETRNFSYQHSRKFGKEGGSTEGLSLDR